jgi:nucleoside-diphosphate-sugar epimerase
MLLTRDNLPKTIADIADLDELLCRPSQALIDDLRKVDGDIMILGVAGKMGPTLAGLAKAAVPDRRIIGVARFSDPAVKDWLQAHGVETINCDLLDEAAIKALPKVPNIVFMAGRKFGAEGDLSLTWAMNSYVPALVAQVFAGSRIVAFSTGCVYPFVPVNGKGSDEDMAPNPPGEYAQSCVGRERMFEYFSRKYSTPGRLFRLNYAIDMRYGVLHDIASKVLKGKPIDVMSISSGWATHLRRRCVVWRIAIRRPRRSMSAAMKSWPCAISPRNSASGLAALPSSPARKSRRPG